MKIKFLPILVCTLIATSLFFSSCLNDNEEEFVYAAESSITSFSIGTVNINRIGKDSLGKDSAYIDTISCAHYPFTIDQLKRTIENKDSLPVGSDVSKVLAKITADTEGIMYERRDKDGNVKDTAWTAVDSIDFTRPVAFKVFAMNGMMGKSYIVTVNVHQQNPDSLEWNHYGTPKFVAGKLYKQKTLVQEQTLYTFGVKADGTVVAEYTNIENGRPNGWKEFMTLPEKTNTYSVQLWNEDIWFVADGKLYRINNGPEGISTEQVGTQTTLRTLIGLGNITAGEEIMFAYDTNNKVIALNENGMPAQPEGYDFIDNLTFVSERMTSATLTTRHNKSLTRTIVMNNSPETAANDSVSCVYGFTTNDAKWGKLNMPATLACPNLENISMIPYDNKLYAFGGGIESKHIKPFEHFYCSTDNGFTWEKITKGIVFPQEDSPKHPDIRPFANYYTPNVEGSYSTTVDKNHFIWLIWEDGSLTKGRLNRLGFAKKW